MIRHGQMARLCLCLIPILSACGASVSKQTKGNGTGHIASEPQRQTETFFAAIRAGDVAAIEKLASIGFSLATRDALGDDASVHARRFNKPEVFSFLCQRVPTLRLCPIPPYDSKQTTLLRETQTKGTPACDNYQLLGMDYVESLLRKGADPTSALIPGINLGDVGFVKMLFQYGSKLEDGIGGSTALHVAMARKQKAIAELLLGYKPNLAITDSTGETPLYEAIRWGDLALFKALCGLNPPVNTQNVRGETPAHLAAVRQIPEILDLVLAMGPNLSLRANDGTTPFAAALKSKAEPQAATLLVALSKELAQQEYIAALSVGHLLSLQGHLRFLRLLAQKGVNFNAPLPNGDALVHVVVRASSEELWDWLVKDSAADLNQKSSEGLSPLQLALTLKNPLAVRRLLSAGVLPEAGDVKLALAQGQADLLEALLNAPQVEVTEHDVLHALDLGLSSDAQKLLKKIPASRQSVALRLHLSVQPGKRGVIEPLASIYSNFYYGSNNWGTEPPLGAFHFSGKELLFAWTHFGSAGSAPGRPARYNRLGLEDFPYTHLKYSLDERLEIPQGVRKIVTLEKENEPTESLVVSFNTILRQDDVHGEHALWLAADPGAEFLDAARDGDSLYLLQRSPAITVANAIPDATSRLTLKQVNIANRTVVRSINLPEKLRAIEAFALDEEFVYFPLFAENQQNSKNKFPMRLQKSSGEMVAMPANFALGGSGFCPVASMSFSSSTGRLWMHCARYSGSLLQSWEPSSGTFSYVNPPVGNYSGDAYEEQRRGHLQLWNGLVFATGAAYPSDGEVSYWRETALVRGLK